MKTSRATIFGAVALVALAIAPTPSIAICDVEPVAVVGVGYTRDYTYTRAPDYASVDSKTRTQWVYSYRWDGGPMTRRWGNPIGTAKVGIACGAISLNAMHYSSLETKRDAGVNLFTAELDLVKAYKAIWK